MNKPPRKKNRENPLPNHIDHSMELRVKQQDKGNGLPQSIAGYDPHLLQTVLIQCVSQQLWEKKKKTNKQQTESKEQREGTNKKVFQIVKYLYWERQHLLQHYLNIFQKQIIFQFLFLQLGQQLLHQTKYNRLSSTKCLQRRTPASSTTPNPKVHEKRKN